MRAGDDDQIPCRGPDSQVKRTPERKLHRRDANDPRPEGFGYRHRPVAGARIDEDDLHIPDGLLSDPFE